MDNITLVKKYHKFVIVFTLFVTVAVFGWSVLRVPKFKSESKVLVLTQHYDNSKALQLSAKIAELWSEIISSRSFMTKVLTSGFSIDEDTFLSEADPGETWDKAIKARVVPGSGILKLEVVSEKRSQALLINQAIHNKLTTSATEYFGHGNEIKVLDRPISAESPAYPRIWINSLIGFLLGFILSILLSYSHYLIPRRDK